jgi:hypothetical protein
VKGKYDFGVVGVDERITVNLKSYILGIWTKFYLIVRSRDGAVVNTVMKELNDYQVLKQTQLDGICYFNS